MGTGYACPVCDTEHADAVHLAHHFGVTASLGRAEHREWLDEHAPDWSERGPEELAAVVAERADPVDVPEFESGGGARPSVPPGDDPAGSDRDRPADGAPDRPASGTGGRGRSTDDVPGRPAEGTDGADAETERVLARAREFTREMYDADAGASDGSGAGEGDGPAERAASEAADDEGVDGEENA